MPHPNRGKRGVSTAIRQNKWASLGLRRRARRQMAQNNQLGILSLTRAVDRRGGVRSGEPEGFHIVIVHFWALNYLKELIEFVLALYEAANYCQLGPRPHL